MPLGEALSMVGTGGQGMLLLLLTLPNIFIVPSVPFLPLVCGIPAIMVLWSIPHEARAGIPGWISSLSVSRAAAMRCLRLTRTLSRIGRPGRFAAGMSAGPLRWLCVEGILLTLVICLPLPLVNIPCGLSMLGLAMGMAARDGLMCWVSAIIGIPSLAAVAWVAIWADTMLGDITGGM